jgi:YD repeat-containing protein
MVNKQVISAITYDNHDRVSGQTIETFSGDSGDMVNKQVISAIAYDNHDRVSGQTIETFSGDSGDMVNKQVISAITYDNHDRVSGQTIETFSGDSGDMVNKQVISAITYDNHDRVKEQAVATFASGAGEDAISAEVVMDIKYDAHDRLLEQWILVYGLAGNFDGFEIEDIVLDARDRISSFTASLYSTESGELINMQNVYDIQYDAHDRVISQVVEIYNNNLSEFISKQVMHILSYDNHDRATAQTIATYGDSDGTLINLQVVEGIMFDAHDRVIGQTITIYNDIEKTIFVNKHAVKNIRYDSYDRIEFQTIESYGDDENGTLHLIHVQEISDIRYNAQDMMEEQTVITWNDLGQTEFISAQKITQITYDMQQKVNHQYIISYTDASFSEIISIEELYIISRDSRDLISEQCIISRQSNGAIISAKHVSGILYDNEHRTVELDTTTYGSDFIFNPTTNSVTAGTVIEKTTTANISYNHEDRVSGQTVIYRTLNGSLAPGGTDIIYKEAITDIAYDGEDRVISQTIIAMGADDAVYQVREMGNILYDNADRIKAYCVTVYADSQIIYKQQINDIAYNEKNLITYQEILVYNRTGVFGTNEGLIRREETIITSWDDNLMATGQTVREYTASGILKETRIISMSYDATTLRANETTVEFWKQGRFVRKEKTVVNAWDPATGMISDQTTTIWQQDFITEQRMYNIQRNTFQQITSYEMVVTEHAGSHTITTHIQRSGIEYYLSNILSYTDTITSSLDDITTTVHMYDMTYAMDGNLELLTFKKTITESASGYHKVTEISRTNTQYNEIGQITGYSETINSMGITAVYNYTDITYDIYDRVLTYRLGSTMNGHEMPFIIRTSTTYNRYGMMTAYQETAYGINKDIVGYDTTGAHTTTSWTGTYKNNIGSLMSYNIYSTNTAGENITTSVSIKAWNSHGFVISEQRLETGPGEDKDGNPVTVTTNSSTTYSYDSSGRVSNKTTNSSTSNTADESSTSDSTTTIQYSSDGTSVSNTQTTGTNSDNEPIDSESRTTSYVDGTKTVEGWFSGDNGVNSFTSWSGKGYPGYYMQKYDILGTKRYHEFKFEWEQSGVAYQEVSVSASVTSVEFKRWNDHLTWHGDTPDDPDGYWEGGWEHKWVYVNYTSAGVCNITQSWSAWGTSGKVETWDKFGESLGEQDNSTQDQSQGAVDYSEIWAFIYAAWQAGIAMANPPGGGWTATGNVNQGQSYDGGASPDIDTDISTAVDLLNAIAGSNMQVTINGQDITQMAINFDANDPESARIIVDLACVIMLGRKATGQEYAAWMSAHSDSASETLSGSGAAFMNGLDSFIRQTIYKLIEENSSYLQEASMVATMAAMAEQGLESTEAWALPEYANMNDEERAAYFAELGIEDYAEITISIYTSDGTFIASEVIVAYINGQYVVVQNAAATYINPDGTLVNGTLYAGAIVSDGVIVEGEFGDFDNTMYVAKQDTEGGGILPYVNTSCVVVEDENGYTLSNGMVSIRNNNMVVMGIGAEFLAGSSLGVINADGAGVITRVTSGSIVLAGITESGQYIYTAGSTGRGVTSVQYISEDGTSSYMTVGYNSNGVSYASTSAGNGSYTYDSGILASIEKRRHMMDPDDVLAVLSYHEQQSQREASYSIYRFYQTETIQVGGNAYSVLARDENGHLVAGRLSCSLTYENIRGEKVTEAVPLSRIISDGRDGVAIRDSEGNWHGFGLQTAEIVNGALSLTEFNGILTDGMAFAIGYSDAMVAASILNFTGGSFTEGLLMQLPELPESISINGINYAANNWIDVANLAGADFGRYGAEPYEFAVFLPDGNEKGVYLICGAEGWRPAADTAANAYISYGFWVEEKVIGTEYDESLDPYSGYMPGPGETVYEQQYQFYQDSAQDIVKPVLFGNLEIEGTNGRGRVVLSMDATDDTRGLELSGYEVMIGGMWQEAEEISGTQENGVFLARTEQGFHVFYNGDWREVLPNQNIAGWSNFITGTGETVLRHQVDIPDIATIWQVFNGDGTGIQLYGISQIMVGGNELDVKLLLTHETGDYIARQVNASGENIDAYYAYNRETQQWEDASVSGIWHIEEGILVRTGNITELFGDNASFMADTIDGLSFEIAEETVITMGFDGDNLHISISDLAGLYTNPTDAMIINGRLTDINLFAITNEDGEINLVIESAEFSFDSGTMFIPKISGDTPGELQVVNTQGVIRPGAEGYFITPMEGRSAQVSIREGSFAVIGIGTEFWEGSRYIVNDSGEEPVFAQVISGVMRIGLDEDGNMNYFGEDGSRIAMGTESDLDEIGISLLPISQAGSWNDLNQGAQQSFIDNYGDAAMAWFESYRQTLRNPHGLYAQSWSDLNEGERARIVNDFAQLLFDARGRSWDESSGSMRAGLLSLVPDNYDEEHAMQLAENIFNIIAINGGAYFVSGNIDREIILTIYSYDSGGISTAHTEIHYPAGFSMGEIFVSGSTNMPLAGNGTVVINYRVEDGIIQADEQKNLIRESTIYNLTASHSVSGLLASASDDPEVRRLGLRVIAEEGFRYMGQNNGAGDEEEWVNPITGEGIASPAIFTASVYTMDNYGNRRDIDIMHRIEVDNGNCIYIGAANNNLFYADWVNGTIEGRQEIRIGITQVETEAGVIDKWETSATGTVLIQVQAEYTFIHIERGISIRWNARGQMEASYGAESSYLPMLAAGRGYDQVFRGSTDLSINDDGYIYYVFSVGDTDGEIIMRIEEGQSILAIDIIDTDMAPSAIGNGIIAYSKTENGTWDRLAYLPSAAHPTADGIWDRFIEYENREDGARFIMHYISMRDVPDGACPLIVYWDENGDIQMVSVDTDEYNSDDLILLNPFQVDRNNELISGPLVEISRTIYEGLQQTWTMQRQLSGEGNNGWQWSQEAWSGIDLPGVSQELYLYAYNDADGMPCIMLVDGYGDTEQSGIIRDLSKINEAQTRELLQGPSDGATWLSFERDGEIFEYIVSGIMVNSRSGSIDIQAYTRSELHGMFMLDQDIKGGGDADGTIPEELRQVFMMHIIIGDDGSASISRISQDTLSDMYTRLEAYNERDILLDITVSDFITYLGLENHYITQEGEIRSFIDLTLNENPYEWLHSSAHEESILQSRALDFFNGLDREDVELYTALYLHDLEFNRPLSEEFRVAERIQNGSILNIPFYQIQFSLNDLVGDDGSAWGQVNSSITFTGIAGGCVLWLTLENPLPFSGELNVEDGVHYGDNAIVIRYIEGQNFILPASGDDNTVILNISRFTSSSQIASALMNEDNYISGNIWVLEGMDITARGDSGISGIYTRITQITADAAGVQAERTLYNAQVNAVLGESVSPELISSDLSSAVTRAPPGMLDNLRIGIGGGRSLDFSSGHISIHRNFGVSFGEGLLSIGTFLLWTIVTLNTFSLALTISDQIWSGTELYDNTIGKIYENTIGKLSSYLFYRTIGLSSNLSPAQFNALDNGKKALIIGLIVLNAVTTIASVLLIASGLGSPAGAALEGGKQGVISGAIAAFNAAAIPAVVTTVANSIITATAGNIIISWVVNFLVNVITFAIKLWAFVKTLTILVVQQIARNIADKTFGTLLQSAWGSKAASNSGYWWFRYFVSNTFSNIVAEIVELFDMDSSTKGMITMVLSALPILVTGNFGGLRSIGLGNALRNISGFVRGTSELGKSITALYRYGALAAATGIILVTTGYMIDQGVKQGKNVFEILGHAAMGIFIGSCIAFAFLLAAVVGVNFIQEMNKPVQKWLILGGAVVGGAYNAYYTWEQGKTAIQDIFLGFAGGVILGTLAGFALAVLFAAPLPAGEDAITNVVSRGMKASWIIGLGIVGAGVNAWGNWKENDSFLNRLNNILTGFVFGMLAGATIVNVLLLTEALSAGQVMGIAGFALAGGAASGIHLLANSDQVQSLYDVVTRIGIGIIIGAILGFALVNNSIRAGLLQTLNPSSNVFIVPRAFSVVSGIAFFKGIYTLVLESISALGGGVMLPEINLGMLFGLDAPIFGIGQARDAEGNIMAGYSAVFVFGMSWYFNSSGGYYGFWDAVNSVINSTIVAVYGVTSDPNMWMFAFGTGLAMPLLGTILRAIPGLSHLMQVFNRLDKVLSDIAPKASIIHKYLTYLYEEGLKEFNTGVFFEALLGQGNEQLASILEELFDEESSGTMDVNKAIAALDRAADRISQVSTFVSDTSESDISAQFERHNHQVQQGVFDSNISRNELANYVNSVVGSAAEILSLIDNQRSSTAQQAGLLMAMVHVEESLSMLERSLSHIQEKLDASPELIAVIEYNIGIVRGYINDISKDMVLSPPQEGPAMDSLLQNARFVADTSCLAQNISVLLSAMRSNEIKGPSRESIARSIANIVEAIEEFMGGIENSTIQDASLDAGGANNLAILRQVVDILVAEQASLAEVFDSELIQRIAAIGRELETSPLNQVRAIDPVQEQAPQGITGQIDEAAQGLVNDANELLAQSINTADSQQRQQLQKEAFVLYASAIADNASQALSIVKAMIETVRTRNADVNNIVNAFFEYSEEATGVKNALRQLLYEALIHLESGQDDINFILGNISEQERIIEQRGFYSAFDKDFVSQLLRKIELVRQLTPGQEIKIRQNAQDILEFLQQDQETTDLLTRADTLLNASQVQSVIDEIRDLTREIGEAESTLTEKTAETGIGRQQKSEIDDLRERISLLRHQLEEMYANYEHLTEGQAVMLEGFIERAKQVAVDNGYLMLDETEKATDELQAFAFGIAIANLLANKNSNLSDQILHDGGLEFSQQDFMMSLFEGKFGALAMAGGKTYAFVAEMCIESLIKGGDLAGMIILESPVAVSKYLNPLSDQDKGIDGLEHSPYALMRAFGLRMVSGDRLIDNLRNSSLSGRAARQKAYEEIVQAFNDSSQVIVISREARGHLQNTIAHASNNALFNAVAKTNILRIDEFDSILKVRDTFIEGGLADGRVSPEKIAAIEEIYGIFNSNELVIGEAIYAIRIASDMDDFRQLRNTGMAVFYDREFDAVYVSTELQNKLKEAGINLAEVESVLRAINHRQGTDYLVTKEGKIVPVGAGRAKYSSMFQDAGYIIAIALDHNRNVSDELAINVSGITYNTTSMQSTLREIFSLNPNAHIAGGSGTFYEVLAMLPIVTGIEIDLRRSAIAMFTKDQDGNDVAWDTITLDREGDTGLSQTITDANNKMDLERSTAPGERIMPKHILATYDGEQDNQQKALIDQIVRGIIASIETQAGVVVYSLDDAMRAQLQNELIRRIREDAGLQARLRVAINQKIESLIENQELLIADLSDDLSAEARLKNAQSLIAELKSDLKNLGDANDELALVKLIDYIVHDERNIIASNEDGEINNIAAHAQRGHAVFINEGGLIGLNYTGDVDIHIVSDELAEDLLLQGIYRVQRADDNIATRVVYVNRSSIQSRLEYFTNNAAQLTTMIAPAHLINESEFFRQAQELIRTFAEKGHDIDKFITDNPQDAFQLMLKVSGAIQMSRSNAFIVTDIAHGYLIEAVKDLLRIYGGHSPESGLSPEARVIQEHYMKLLDKQSDKRRAALDLLDTPIDAEALISEIFDSNANIAIEFINEFIRDLESLKTPRALSIVEHDLRPLLVDYENVVLRSSSTPGTFKDAQSYLELYHAARNFIPYILPSFSGDAGGAYRQTVTAAQARTSITLEATGESAQERGLHVNEVRGAIGIAMAEAQDDLVQAGLPQGPAVDIDALAEETAMRVIGFARNYDMVNQDEYLTARGMMVLESAIRLMILDLEIQEEEWEKVYSMARDIDPSVDNSPASIALAIIGLIGISSRLKDFDANGLLEIAREYHALKASYDGFDITPAQFKKMLFDMQEPIAARGELAKALVSAYDKGLIKGNNRYFRYLKGRLRLDELRERAAIIRYRISQEKSDSRKEQLEKALKRLQRMITLGEMAFRVRRLSEDNVYRMVADIAGDDKMLHIALLAATFSDFAWEIDQIRELVEIRYRQADPGNMLDMALAALRYQRRKSDLGSKVKDPALEHDHELIAASKDYVDAYRELSGMDIGAENKALEEFLRAQGIAVEGEAIDITIYLQKLYHRIQQRGHIADADIDVFMRRDILPLGLSGAQTLAFPENIQRLFRDFAATATDSVLVRWEDGELIAEGISARRDMKDLMKVLEVGLASIDTIMEYLKAQADGGQLAGQFQVILDAAREGSPEGVVVRMVRGTAGGSIAEKAQSQRILMSDEIIRPTIALSDDFVRFAKAAIDHDTTQGRMAAGWLILEQMLHELAHFNIAIEWDKKYLPKDLADEIKNKIMVDGILTRILYESGALLDEVDHLRERTIHSMGGTKNHYAYRLNVFTEIDDQGRRIIKEPDRIIEDVVIQTIEQFESQAVAAGISQDYIDAIIALKQNQEDIVNGIKGREDALADPALLRAIIDDMLAGILDIAGPSKETLLMAQRKAAEDKQPLLAIAPLLVYHGLLEQAGENDVGAITDAFNVFTSIYSIANQAMQAYQQALNDGKADEGARTAAESIIKTGISGLIEQGVIKAGVFNLDEPVLVDVVNMVRAISNAWEAARGEFGPAQAVEYIVRMQIGQMRSRIQALSDLGHDVDSLLLQIRSDMSLEEISAIEARISDIETGLAEAMPARVSSAGLIERALSDIGTDRADYRDAIIAIINDPLNQVEVVESTQGLLGDYDNMALRLSPDLIRAIGLLNDRGIDILMSILEYHNALISGQDPLQAQAEYLGISQESIRGMRIQLAYLVEQIYDISHNPEISDADRVFLTDIILDATHAALSADEIETAQKTIGQITLPIADSSSVVKSLAETITAVLALSYALKPAMPVLELRDSVYAESAPALTEKTSTTVARVIETSRNYPGLLNVSGHIAAFHANELTAEHAEFIRDYLNSIPSDNRTDVAITVYGELTQASQQAISILSESGYYISLDRLLEGTAQARQATIVYAEGTMPLSGLPADYIRYVEIGIRGEGEYVPASDLLFAIFHIPFKIFLEQYGQRLGISDDSLHDLLVNADSIGTIYIKPVNKDEYIRIQSLVMQAA